MLVVDDNPDILYFLERFLVMAGYEVATAESGRSALELLKNGLSIDAVISDILMPDGSGTWLAESMRKDGITVPVFLITAGSDISREEALRCGANGFFRKPLDIDVLEAALNRALAR